MLWSNSSHWKTVCWHLLASLEKGHDSERERKKQQQKKKSAQFQEQKLLSFIHHIVSTFRESWGENIKQETHTQ